MRHETGGFKARIPGTGQLVDNPRRLASSDGTQRASAHMRLDMGSKLSPPNKKPPTLVFAYGEHASMLLVAQPGDRFSFYGKLSETYGEQDGQPYEKGRLYIDSLVLGDDEESRVRVDCRSEWDKWLLETFSNAMH